MKKFASICLIFALVFSLVGCGSDKPDEPKTATENEIATAKETLDDYFSNMHYSTLIYDSFKLLSDSAKETVDKDYFINVGFCTAYQWNTPKTALKDNIIYNKVGDISFDKVLVFKTSATLNDFYSKEKLSLEIENYLVFENNAWRVYPTNFLGLDQSAEAKKHYETLRSDIEADQEKKRNENELKQKELEKTNLDISKYKETENYKAFSEIPDHLSTITTILTKNAPPYSDQLKIQLAVAIASVNYSCDQIDALEVAPTAKAYPVHQKLLEASVAYRKSMDHLTKAIDNVDSAELTLVNDLWNEGAIKITEAAKLISK